MADLTFMNIPGARESGCMNFCTPASVSKGEVVSEIKIKTSHRSWEQERFVRWVENGKDALKCKEAKGQRKRALRNGAE